MRKNILTFYLLLLHTCLAIAQNQSKADQWVATDAIGRTLPTHADVGDLKPNRIVGVFYYIWQGYHGDKVYDITKILKGQGTWGPVNQFHFWSEPEYGYFRSTDPWVIRRDLQMFSNAKVDFIFFDVTNAVTYLETVNKLCEISRQMRAEGIQTPQIAFMTNSSSGAIMNSLYNDFYSKNSYSDLWFRWQGKPLIFGDFNDPTLQQNVKDFFTIKYSWAGTDQSKPNSWQWLDWTPQDYGWSTDRNVPEQMTVTTAFHPSNPHGQSYKNGQQPAVDGDYKTQFTGQGRYAQEQWDYALQVDAPLIMVTQWNEWLAQRFLWEQAKGDGQYAGRPIKVGDSYFVDVFNEEFNRDMAPMKGGHTDNNYYQLVSNIRRYKGMATPLQATTQSTIAIDGDFSAWQNIQPVQWDPTNDVMHRDHASYDPSVQLTNTSGRNDIVEARASYDSDNIYFYAKTVNNITAFSEPGWMLLLINTDKNKTTGWNGYDYIINYGVNSSTQTTVKKWNGSAWVGAETTEYRVVNNQLELKVLRSQVGLIGVNEFYYKWVDNPLQLNDMEGIFTNGDAAPDRRFDYFFQSSGQIIAQTPYTGTAYPIPGIIEAENFDKGGEGVAYHDTESGNLGAQYRTAEGVDIEVCGEGGYDLGWTAAGEWQEYSVNVLATGTYKVAARVSSGTATPGSFHIEFDGVNTSGTIDATATGGWQTWTNINDTFNLTAGTHIMRVYYEKSDVNVNNFTFTNLSTTGTGNGLAGNYFNGMNFETPVFSRRDDVINFDWNTGSPDATVNIDQFSARWTGQIQAKYTDTYTFYLNSDNGRRLWINGQLIIDKWIGDWGTEYTGTIALKAGQKYDIKLEYFEENGGANCKLEWSSPTQAREVVPKNQLYANQLPTVSITAPTNNAQFTAPASVMITANASDADGMISKVEFYNGTTLLNSDATAPYSYNWINVAVGTYSITARVYDNANAITISTVISIQVNAANQLPTVNITAPTNNAQYTAPASVMITANASDADGSISKVEFYNGTTLLNSDNTAPYNYNWTNVAAGSYTITAKAYDNVNAVTTSTAISIQVNAPANQLPTVSLTAPTNNAQYTAPASVTITANANDADGSISKVEFYNGTTLLNSDNTSPYSYNWTNVSAGTYSITAKAYDNTNAVTTSTAISIQVNTPANQLPTVSITAPTNNAVYTAPASITIIANANDVDGTISKVEFYNGATLLNTDNIAPYSYTWTNVISGTYMITAKAYDNVQASTTSTTVTIQVNTPPNQVPTVTITAPSNNTVYSTLANLTITADASDADGSVTKVEFYSGVTLLGADNTAPYTYIWSNVGVGTYIVTAKVYDNLNASTISLEVEIEVEASIPTSINSVANALGIVSSPMPFQTTTRIQTPLAIEIQNIIIYNAMGQEVQRIENISENEVSIGEALIDGIYLLHINTSKGTATLKVLKGN